MLLRSNTTNLTNEARLQNGKLQPTVTALGGIQLVNVYRPSSAANTE